MIDIWMIVSMMFLFFEVSLHACKAVLTKPKKTTEGEDQAKNVNWSCLVVAVHPGVPDISTRSLGTDKQ